jgi:hypothetical protein
LRDDHRQWLADIALLLILLDALWRLIGWSL